MPSQETVPIPRGEMEVALGVTFRKARRAEKMSLRVLAERMKISVNTIRWHEAGARPMRADMLSRAADILGVATAALVTTEAEERKHDNSIA